MSKTTFEINELLGRNQSMEELAKVECLLWFSEEELLQIINDLKYDCDVGYCIDLEELQQKLKRRIK